MMWQHSKHQTEEPATFIESVFLGISQRNKFGNRTTLMVD